VDDDVGHLEIFAGDSTRRGGHVTEPLTTTDELGRFRLDDRVAIVTGGTGGIGSRLCAAFARVGARVVVHGRDAGRVGAEVAGLRAEGAEALGVVADLTRAGDADRMAAEAMTAYGRVDVIVNTVGGGAGTALYAAEEYPEAEWDRIMDLNLRAALLPTQAAVRAMIAGGRGGRVLHFSSVRGQLGIDNGFSAYVAAKGALDALTRQQATEWAKHRITVNTISPTFVATPQSASLLADDEFRAGLEQRIPLRRIADTDDLVGAALLFCSAASGFITGQILTLDGGLTACQ
jgi:NAD(P)-dependent dehydrogenase (short-subunit alcohol dehydrogenase family)